MKKTTLIIVVLVVAICCLFGMVACNNGEHTHDYDSAWTHDSTHHWHECKGEGACDAKQKDKAVHVDEDSNGKCDVCDFAMNGGESVGKEQYAKVLNALVNYFEPQQATPQAVAKRRGITSSVLPEEITLDDILTYTLDASTQEGAYTLSLPLTYSYLLAVLCDNDNFVVGDKPVQFVATVESMTITFVCDFNYDTTADKLTLDLQVNNVVAPGIDSLLHCEIAYDEDADEVGDFLIHGARTGASGINGEIESYAYLTIRNQDGVLKMCNSSYFIADGRMIMESTDEFANEFGAYHVGLLDDLMEAFDAKTQDKDVLQQNFASEFMQAGQYVRDLTNRLINGGGSVGGSDVDVESITLDNTTLVLDMDEYVMLNVQFNPSNATHKTVVWQSSNEEVATVENGKVHALKEGETTITATTSNGKSATCLVKVNGATQKELTEEEWQTALSKDSFVNFIASMMLTGEDGEFVIKADLANFKYNYNNNEGAEYFMSKENDVYYEYARKANDNKFTRSEKTQQYFEDQLWFMEAMFVANLADSYSQFTYDSNREVYVGRGVAVAGSNYDVTLGFEGGKLVSADLDFGEDVHMVVSYTYGNAVVNLPTDFVDGGSGGDLKPRPSVVGKTYEIYDVTSSGAPAEMLDNLRAQLLGNVYATFDSDTQVTLITRQPDYEIIQVCTYVVEGNTVTVTIVSGTMNGTDMTDQMKGETSVFTFEGDTTFTMELNTGDYILLYHFRVQA